jgi:hypothetical protein
MDGAVVGMEAGAKEAGRMQAARDTASAAISMPAQRDFFVHSDMQEIILSARGPRGKGQRSNILDKN